MEKIALLPGGFKPPHAGHYNMAKWLAKNTDANTVVVKVGAKEREGITRDISLELWDLYRSTDSDPAAQKLTILPSTSPSPVKDVYDFVEVEAPENSTVYLGLGEKDLEDKRYANIGKFAEPRGINFETNLVPPQAGGVSGTQMRNFIKDEDEASFKQFLPDHLTDEQKDKAWNLVSSVIVKETFSSLFSEYHQNLINEDIKDYGHIKEYNLDLTNSYNYSNNDNFWVFYDDVNDLDIYAKLKANKSYKEFKFYPDPQSGIGFGKLKHHNPKNLNTIFNIFLNEVLPNNPKVLIQPADNIRYRLFKALINNNLPQDGYNVYLSSNDDPIDGSPKIIVTQKTPIKEETTQGKTLYAFDLDDTLITSNSQVIIKNKNTGEITKLTPAQYATYVPKEEDELDFQEFAQLINPQAISKNFQDFAQILKVVSGKPNITAIILTARQPEVQTDVNAFLDKYNLDNIQIHAVGSSDPQAKAKVVQDYINNGYDKIRFYDDAVKNVKAIQALELTNQGVDILAKKVAFNTGLSEMMAGTMNKQELAKHQKNLKKLNKVFRKQGDQMVPVPDYIKGTLTRKLYEGRYDNEVTTISNMVINYLKDTLGKRVKNTFEDAGELKGEPYDVEVIFLPTQQFQGIGGGLPFIVNAAGDEDTVAIQIDYEASQFPKAFNKLIPELKDAIRHELEHVAQFRFNKDAVPTNVGNQNDLPLVDYLTLDYEIPAFVQGIYKNAKTRKVPFSQALQDFLDERSDDLTPDQETKVKKMYLAYAKKNLPAAQIKEAPKKKTEYLKNQKNEMYGIQSPIYRAKDVSDVAFHLGKIYGGDNPAKKKSIKESQTYILDTPKYNNLPIDKVYYQLSSLVKEIKLTKDNATEIIGTPTKGNFKVGEIEYTYNIVKKSSPYKDNEDFYLIEFDEKEGKGDSEPTKNAKESYIKILSTLYKVVLNFLEKEQPTYFGISALDKSGYWNVYNQLTKQNQIPGYSRKDAGLKFTTNSEETGKMVILKKNQNMKETKLFSKEWWGGVIDEILTEGGAAGHMAHPFDLPNVTKGNDLIQTFEKAAKSLETTPGAVKIDGVNASIRLGNFDGKRQFVMDRGSKKELDIKGVTKADLEDRFGAGHGMIKAGGDVLDIFNAALKDTQPELEKLGLWDDPNIMFNMEYVTGKTNVQEYEKNFLAIHGLLKIEMKEVEGKRGPLMKRVTTEQPYNKADLQTYLNKLAPFAEEKGFEVYGSVPTKFTKSPDFNKELNTQYTIEFTDKKETKSLKNWLKDVDYIPKTDRLKMNLETGGTKDVGALSKQVYFAVFGGENIEDLFDNEQDIKKAIQGAVTYLATEKLGDAILDVLDSPMGSVNNHEGVVIRDKSISPKPFKVTGKFITGGVSSQFQQKENINENEETINFDIKDVGRYKVVLATFGNRVVGKLRVIPQNTGVRVDQVTVVPDYKGFGIGKEMYRMAHEEMGPLFSDKKRTQDAEYLWQSLVKSGEAEPIKDGMYVMKEANNPPQYDVADEIGNSMYTSDIR